MQVPKSRSDDVTVRRCNCGSQREYLIFFMALPEDHLYKDISPVATGDYNKEKKKQPILK